MGKVKSPGQRERRHLSKQKGLGLGLPQGCSWLEGSLPQPGCSWCTTPKPWGGKEDITSHSLDLYNILAGVPSNVLGDLESTNHQRPCGGAFWEFRFIYVVFIRRREKGISVGFFFHI